MKNNVSDRKDLWGINENAEKRYFKGGVNKAVRLYYYLQQGLQQINAFKNIILGVVAIAVMMRFEQDYFVMGLIGLTTLPFIVVLGWLWIKRGKMSTQYFETKYASPYGRYGMKVQDIHLDYFLENGVPPDIKQLELLKEILELLKKQNGGK